MIGELTANQLLVVLNKIDLFPSDTRETKLEKLRRGLAATFSRTRFAGCRMVEVAARPGGGDNAAGFDGSGAVGVEAVTSALLEMTDMPARSVHTCALWICVAAMMRVE